MLNAVQDVASAMEDLMEASNAEGQEQLETSHKVRHACIIVHTYGQ